MISCALPDGVAPPFAIHKMASTIIAAVPNERNAPAQGSSPSARIERAEGFVTPHVFTPLHQIARWNSFTEGLFQRLVVRRGERVITAEERAKLNWLRSERQRLKNPLPADQLLRDFKARELRNFAIEALKRYVDFIEEPSRRSQT